MIEIKGVTKRFQEKIALDNVEFSIPKGSVFGLVGSNGSGKSTLLRLISGVYSLDGGEILVDGVTPFNSPKTKAQICYLADTPYFVHQSNINEMAKLYKSIYPTFSDEKFEYLKTIFPLDTKIKISTMSKGMQRQAALMLCLAVKPKYLLLDEAFDGLDPVMRESLKRLIAKDIIDRDLTVIITSHNLRELEDMCDKVGLLHKGKIIFNDNLENLKGKVHKIQTAFNKIPSENNFSELDLLKFERTGSMVQIVARGKKDEILEYINRMDPILLETIQPTLEELFIFELGGLGYDFAEVLE